MLSNRYVAGAVTLALLLVAAYNIYYFRARGQGHAVSASKTSPPAYSAAAAPKDTATASGPINLFEPADKSAWKRDPFAVARAKSPKEAGAPHLQAILHRNGRSFALLNGRVYRLSERVGDAVLSEIRKDRVVLSLEGQRQEILLDDIIPLKEKTR